MKSTVVFVLCLALVNFADSDLLEMSQELWSRVLNGGFLQLGKVDPLRVPVIKVDQSEGDMSYRVLLRNLEVSGLNNSRIESVQIVRGRLSSNLSDNEAGYVSHNEARAADTIRYRFHTLVKEPKSNSEDRDLSASDNFERFMFYEPTNVGAGNEDDLVKSSAQSEQHQRYYFNPSTGVRRGYPAEQREDTVFQLYHRPQYADMKVVMNSTPQTPSQVRVVYTHNHQSSHVELPRPCVGACRPNYASNVRSGAQNYPSQPQQYPYAAESRYYQNRANYEPSSPAPYGVKVQFGGNQRPQVDVKGAQKGGVQYSANFGGSSQPEEQNPDQFSAGYSGYPESSNTGGYKTGPFAEKYQSTARPQNQFKVKKGPESGVSYAFDYRKGPMSIQSGNSYTSTGRPENQYSSQAYDGYSSTTQRPENEFSVKGDNSGLDYSGHFEAGPFSVDAKSDDSSDTTVQPEDQYSVKGGDQGVKNHHERPNGDHHHGRPNGDHHYQKPNGGHQYEKPNEGHQYEKPNGDHHYERPNDGYHYDKPNGNHHYERPNGDHHYDRPNGDHNYDRPNEDHHYQKPNGDHHYERPNGDHHYERPNGDHNYDRPNGDHHYQKPNGDHHYERPNGDHHYERPNGNHHYERPNGDHHYERPNGDHHYERPNGDHHYERPNGDHHYDRPNGDHNYDRPNGNHHYERPNGDHHYERPNGDHHYERPNGDHHYERPNGDHHYEKPNCDHHYEKPNGDHHYERPHDGYHYDKPNGGYHYERPNGHYGSASNNYEVRAQAGGAKLTAGSSRFGGQSDTFGVNYSGSFNNGQFSLNAGNQREATTSQYYEEFEPYKSPVIRLENQPGYVDIVYAPSGVHTRKYSDPRQFGRLGSNVNQTAYNYTEGESLTNRNNAARVAGDSGRINDLLRYAKEYQEEQGFYEEGMELVYHFGNLSGNGTLARTKRQHQNDTEEDDLMHVVLRLRIPQLGLKSNYALEGKVGQRQLKGGGLLSGNFTDVVADFTVELKRVDNRTMIVRAARAKLVSTARKLRLQGMDENGPVASILSHGLMAAEAVAAMIADDLVTKALNENNNAETMIYKMYKNLPVLENS